MYRAREALVLHAAATPYRDRSHFDAQNVLEAGGVDPERRGGGWLNRALAALDAAGDAREAVALADSVPLVLRGELAVTSWAPSRLPVTGRRHAGARAPAVRGRGPRARRELERRARGARDRRRRRASNAWTAAAA